MVPSQVITRCPRQRNLGFLERKISALMPGASTNQLTNQPMPRQPATACVHFRWEAFVHPGQKSLACGEAPGFIVEKKVFSCDESADRRWVRFCLLVPTVGTWVPRGMRFNFWPCSFPHPELIPAISQVGKEMTIENKATLFMFNLECCYCSTPYIPVCSFLPVVGDV